jgi:hypothetical protein
MNKKCNICEGEMLALFTQKVLEKYDVQYFRCNNCHLIQTEEPYWLPEAYQNTITKTDSGYLGRNILTARTTLILFYILFGKKYTYLDYAGGYGIFARLMNDYGMKFRWSDEYTENIFAEDLIYTDQKIRAITCFECFEHFYTITEECEKMLSITNTIFFSTKTIPEQEVPDPATWGYYGFTHGQHLTFYTEKSLRLLAEKNKLHFYTDGKNFHMMTPKKISGLLFSVLLKLPKIQLDLIVRKLH